jgi:hypothetical protein
MATDIPMDLHWASIRQQGYTSQNIVQLMGGLFRLRYFTIVGYFYYLILLKLLHVSDVRPSSSGNVLGFTRLTTDPLILEYS